MGITIWKFFNTPEGINSEIGVMNLQPRRDSRMSFRMSTKSMKLKLFAKSRGCALRSNFSEVQVQSFHQLLKGIADPKMLERLAHSELAPSQAHLFSRHPVN